MNPDDFEKRLQSQPLRQIPSEWRQEILREAQISTRIPKLENRNSLLSTLNHQLSTFLWPSPKAWGALAALWIAIGAIQFAASDHLGRITKRSAPPSAEVLQEQNQLLADLLRTTPLTLQRTKQMPPQPRSERQTQTSAI